MPTVTVDREDVTAEEAIEAVCTQLGDPYTITSGGGSGDVFKVKKGGRPAGRVRATAPDPA